MSARRFGTSWLARLLRARRLAGTRCGAGLTADGPDGRVRTGELFVTADIAAGRTARIWVDQSAG